VTRRFSISVADLDGPDAIDGPVRHLLFLTPDQLSLDYVSAANLDKNLDTVLLIESRDDFLHVPSHKQRTVLLLSAMRHFVLDLRSAGYRIVYLRLDDPDRDGDLGTDLIQTARALRPKSVIFFRPGDWRTLDILSAVEANLDRNVEWSEDPHFYLTPEEFSAWAADRKSLVLEHFYRWMRRRTGTLITETGQPAGGQWNFDRQNRRPLDAEAPEPGEPSRFEPDAITREVMELVEAAFPDAPGQLDEFWWPVTRLQAKEALRAFIRDRLPWFGDYQDALAKRRPWLFHSLLSPALNLKLLDPRECIDAAIEALGRDHAPLNAVEGFVRQILGWREFIRGVYWTAGRDYASSNHLQQVGQLPHFYWTGETDMACARDALQSVLDYGYGHHIQRLMVTGNLALTSGVDPHQISDWYLGMYVDAMDWVTLPNTLGMVMFADGGLVATKPYASTGKYIDRMSDYCGSCHYDPSIRSGKKACPLTTFYWDFLQRNRNSLEAVPRLRPMLANLDRLADSELLEIQQRADELRSEWAVVQQAHRSDGLRPTTDQ
jgi:deoxyribodipyrimidine photolyase-related protein